MPKVTLYTYGYQGGNQAKLDDLIKSGAILCDVRLKPFSRIPGYNGSEFQRRYGRQYLHIDDLGNENYKGGPVKLKNAQAGIDIVSEIMATGRAVILMCACRDAATCHRTHAAKLVADAIGQCEVVDLGWSSQSRPKPKDDGAYLFD